MDELIAERIALSDELRAANYALRDAQEKSLNADAALLRFDGQHPQVMLTLHKVRGEQKKAASAAAIDDGIEVQHVGAADVGTLETGEAPE